MTHDERMGVYQRYRGNNPQELADLLEVPVLETSLPDGLFGMQLKLLGQDFICLSPGLSDEDRRATLAHELGHAYHGDCVKHLSILNADYPMTLAETASIFNETMLVAKLQEGANPQERLMLLDQQIGNAAQVVVDILSRFLFESEVIERRKDHTMLPDELKEIMLDAQKQTYGDGLDENVLHPYMWACKTHYYSASLHFYNFPYAFGLLFGLGVYERYLEKGEAFLPEYDALLAATGLGDVKDVAARVGIDVTDVNFWRKSLSVVEKMIDEMEKLA